MTDQKPQKSNLFNEFSPVSLEEWESVLTRDLGGADYREKLKWHTLEGIELQPFYRRDDFNELPYTGDKFTAVTPAQWNLCPSLPAPDPVKANKIAREALDGGAKSLQFSMEITADEGMLGGDLTGTQVHTLEDLKKLLKGIDLGKTGLVFDSGAGSVYMLSLIKAYFHELEETPPSRNISFLYDPFTFMAGHGRLPLPQKELDSVITQMAEETGFNTLAADGAFYHNAGATIIQELGIALSIGSEYLARIPKNLQEQAAGLFWMKLASGSLYFPEIAKFRAARLLWGRVLDGYEIENRTPLLIHATTSNRNKAIADPHNNMLRVTTEAMAAVIGGANRITIQPYNESFEQPNPFSRRIARNVSHIMEHESHLSEVANAADGSYYIEVLTDQIARKAWDFFRLIENQGGFRKAIEAKIIQGEVGRSRLEREKALTTRKIVMAGVNNYPNPEEDLPEALYYSSYTDSFRITDANPEIDENHLIENLTDALREGAAIGDLVTAFIKPQKQLYPALKPYRDAEPFERLRLKTKHFSEKRGNNIHVQLVPVGNKKMRKARASFSQNYLQCAGFKVDSLIGYDTVDKAEKELKNEEADVYVLCGSDDEYPELVKPFCDAFGDNSIVLLAGSPKDKIEEYRNAGIDKFIYTGSDMIQVLSELQKELGI